VRIIVAAPYYVDPSFGVDPIANAIGTYVLARDRAYDAAVNNGFIHYSLTPSGQSYSVDSPSFPNSVYASFFYVPNGGVYALASVGCGTLSINGVNVPGVFVNSASMLGKFIANQPIFDRFDVFTSTFTMPNPRPSAACGLSSQTSGRLSVRDGLVRYYADGVSTSPFPFSYVSFDDATITLQING
jgi:hypothetical protein